MKKRNKMVISIIIFMIFSSTNLVARQNENMPLKISDEFSGAHNVYFISIGRVLQIIEEENNLTTIILKGVTLRIGEGPILEIGDHWYKLINYTSYGIVNKYFICAVIVDHFT